VNWPRDWENVHTLFREKSNIHVQALVPENIYHMEFPNLLPSVKYCLWPYAIWHHPSLVLSESLLSSCYKLGVWWSCLQEETSHQNKRVVQIAALRLSGVCEYFFCNRWYRCARVHCRQVMPCNLILIVSRMMMRYMLLRNRWIHISIFVCSVRQLCWTGAVLEFIIWVQICLKFGWIVVETSRSGFGPSTALKLHCGPPWMLLSRCKVLPIML
jgi:hypothetical protein